MNTTSATYESIRQAMLSDACQRLAEAMKGAEEVQLQGRIIKKGKTLYVKIGMGR